jgi:predicted DNA-binding transcriptional regulator AlpA
MDGIVMKEQLLTSTPPVLPMVPSCSVGTSWPDNMRPKVAADYLGISKSFLDQSRLTGTGPKFVKVSPTMVLYRRVDLDAWMEARVVRSTAEADRLNAA